MSEISIDNNNALICINAVEVVYIKDDQGYKQQFEADTTQRIDGKLIIKVLMKGYIKV